MDRKVLLVILGFICAGVAYVVGYPMTAYGVLAGLPIGLLNYQMMYAVRRQLSEGGDAAKHAGALVQRTMLRLLVSAGALLLASLLGPEFLIGALLGIVLEVLSYFGDAMRMFVNRKE